VILPTSVLVWFFYPSLLPSPLSAFLSLDLDLVMYSILLPSLSYSRLALLGEICWLSYSRSYPSPSRNLLYSFLLSRCA